MSILIVQQLCQEYVANASRGNGRRSHTESEEFLFRKRFNYKLKKVWNHRQSRYDKNYVITFDGEVISNDLKTLKDTLKFINEKVKG